MKFTTGNTETLALREGTPPSAVADSGADPAAPGPSDGRTQWTSESRRPPAVDAPLRLQVAHRCAQLEHCRDVFAWWESLTDDYRAYIVEAYRRQNGGFGNEIDAMMWRRDRRGESRPYSRPAPGGSLQTRMLTAGLARHGNAQCQMKFTRENTESAEGRQSATAD